MFCAYIRIHIYLRADTVLCTTVICTKRLIKHHIGAQFLAPLYFASLSIQTKHSNTDLDIDCHGIVLRFLAPKYLYITIGICLKICKSYKR